MRVATIVTVLRLAFRSLIYAGLILTLVVGFSAQTVAAGAPGGATALGVLSNAGQTVVTTAAGSLAAPQAERITEGNEFDTAALVAQTVYLLNQERARAGLLPLKVVSSLTTAAAGHSQDMALNDFFGHTSSNGYTLANRLTAAGYVNWIGGGENIAAGFDTAEAVMAGWMGSIGHRNNILNATYREVGVGLYYQADDLPTVRLPDGSLGGPYNFYWTQNFGARSSTYPVIINLEAPITDNPQVTLAIYGQGWATQMQVSNQADFAGANWEPYTNNKTWTMTGGNGVQIVYAKLRSSYGVELVSSDEIQLVGQPDQTPTPTPGPTPMPTPTPSPTPMPTPTPSPTPGAVAPPAGVSINNGQPYTGQAVVTLALELPAGARKVEGASNSNFTGAQPLPVASQVEWQLNEAVAGQQTVYIRYRDAAGQLSATASASIIYDPLPPTGRVTITANNGLSLLVSVDARDTLSGIAAMAVGLSPDQMIWQTYLTVVKLPLPTGGQSTPPVVYARFRDRAGNESSLYRSDQPAPDEQRTFIPLSGRGW